MYLEWAPSDVLSQSSTSKGNQKNDAVVGEHDAKRALLEQQLEGVTDADIDPDRVEVGHINEFFSCSFSLFCCMLYIFNANCFRDYALFYCVPLWSLNMSNVFFQVAISLLAVRWL